MTDRVIHGDCIEEMRKLPESSVDVIITSPPYNLGIEYSSYRDDMPRVDYLSWTRRWMIEVERVMKLDGSFFLNVGGSSADPWIPFDVAGEARNLGFLLQNKILWVKSIHVVSAGEGHTHGHVKPINSPRFLNGTNEFIFHFTLTGRVRIDRYVAGVGVPFSHPSNLTRWTHHRKTACGGNSWHIPYKTIQSKNERGRHPATFPIELPIKCLKLAGAGPGNVALDPFGGIGSTAMACRSMGVACISMDIDTDYCRITSERLAQADIASMSLMSGSS